MARKRLLVGLFIIYMLLLLVHVCIDPITDDIRPYLPKVSGYYGPGSHWVWVLGTIYVFASHEWKLMALALLPTNGNRPAHQKPSGRNSEDGGNKSVHEREQERGRKTTSIQAQAGLDAGFLYAILYPVSCIAHGIFCLVKYLNADSEDEQYTARVHIEASLTVAGVAALLAAPSMLCARLAIFPRTLHSTPLRLMFTDILVLVCNIPVIMAAVMMKNKSGIYIGVVNFLQTLPSPRGSRDRGLGLPTQQSILAPVVFKFTHCTLAFGRFALRAYHLEKVTVTFPMPRSGSSILELDQLAPLVIAVSIVLYQMRGLFRASTIASIRSVFSRRVPTAASWYGASRVMPRMAPGL